MKENVHVIKSAILNHHIVAIRRVETKPSDFRRHVKQIGIIELSEALKDIKTIETTVTTPLETYVDRAIDEDKICLVPILRAGLGMLEGAMELLPDAHVGHIGMRRDEVTHMAEAYYSNLPKNIGEMTTVILDPMLATGGSAIDAIEEVRKLGAKDIIFACIIAAPEGVKKVNEKYPDIPIYIGALDRQLNDKAYIMPGLGDAGDRIFNTVDFQ